MNRRLLIVFRYILNLWVRVINLKRYLAWTNFGSMDFRLAFSSFKIAHLFAVYMYIKRWFFIYFRKKPTNIKCSISFSTFTIKSFSYKLVVFAMWYVICKKCIKMSITCLSYYRNASVFLIDTFDICTF